MNEEDFYKQKGRPVPTGTKLYGRDYISASHVEHGLQGVKGIRAKVDTGINQKQREVPNLKKTVIQLE